LDPAHSHDLVEVSVPFIPRLLSASFFTSRQRRRIQISAIRRQHQAHLTSLHRLLPLPQSTPAARHPPYEVGSELGARGTRPRRRGEARTASRGLLQGAAGCRGRLRTWRSRLRRTLPLVRVEVSCPVDLLRFWWAGIDLLNSIYACIPTFDLYTMNLGFSVSFSKMIYPI